MHLPSWISNSSKSSQALALLLFIIVIFMSLYILEDRHSSSSLTHKNFCFMNFSMFETFYLHTRYHVFFRLHCVSLDDRSIVSRTIAVSLINPSSMNSTKYSHYFSQYIYIYKNQTLQFLHYSPSQRVKKILKSKNKRIKEKQERGQPKDTAFTKIRIYKFYIERYNTLSIITVVDRMIKYP